MRIRILGAPVDNITRKDALQRLLDFLKENKNHIVITPNPEMVLETEKDKEFLRIMEKADLVIPDGIGLVYASRLQKNKIKERVAGVDLFTALIATMEDTGHTLYLFGASPGVADAAKKNLEEKHPRLKIVGTHNGYFDAKEERLIIKDIQEKKPDVLLVGLGFPRQEKWIYQHRKRLPVKISAGVGGTIDVMGGHVKRAPIIFQRLGLEWLHRLLLQPTRIGRMMKLPLFAWKVIVEKRNRK